MPFLWVDFLRHMRKSMRVTFPNSSETGVASSSANEERRASKLGSSVLSYSMLFLSPLTAATVWLLVLQWVKRVAKRIWGNGVRMARETFSKLAAMLPPRYCHRDIAAAILSPSHLLRNPTHAF
jgi:hypothetical protein